ncbi:MAG: hypothetical protein IJY93_04990 [Clostridia bacterium]|nr:hypothetical protein [Clostridia bacterium]
MKRNKLISITVSEDVVFIVNKRRDDLCRNCTAEAVCAKNSTTDRTAI